jgi:hypothetical protein
MKVLITENFAFHAGQYDDLPTNIRKLIHNKGLLIWRVISIKIDGGRYIMAQHEDNNTLSFSTNGKVTYVEVY